jgi:hypothetical protein
LSEVKTDPNKALFLTSVIERLVIVLWSSNSAINPGYIVFPPSFNNLKSLMPLIVTL